MRSAAVPEDPRGRAMVQGPVPGLEPATAPPDRGQTGSLRLRAPRPSRLRTPRASRRPRTTSQSSAICFRSLPRCRSWRMSCSFWWEERYTSAPRSRARRLSGIRVSTDGPVQILAALTSCCRRRPEVVARAQCARRRMCLPSRDESRRRTRSHAEHASALAGLTCAPVAPFETGRPAHRCDCSRCFAGHSGESRPGPSLQAAPC